MTFFGFAKGLVKGVFHLLYRIRVEGEENIPPEGGVIICGNHFHAFDPICVGISMRRPVSFMGKQELFKPPLLGWLLRHLNVFPVKRGQPDRPALKHSIDVLEAGGCFGIFPEGTRSHTGTLRKAEPGTAYLALKSGAPVVPVGISASYKLFSPVYVRFGPAIDMEPFKTGKLSSEALDAAGEAIMAGIGAQLTD